MSKRMLVNVVEREEKRVAIIEGDLLQELSVERASKEQLVGNIYRANVINVEPSLQAAFVDFGEDRNGFLHSSDVCSLYRQPSAKTQKGTRGKAEFPIQSALKRGQEIIIQVSKERMGKKAPKVTTYISLPGRYMVLMPYVVRRGVSRKIADEKERARLKEILSQLDLPDGMGFIARTAAGGRTKRDFRRDLTYLTRLWNAVQKRAKKTDGPAILYQESDLIIRALRDLYSSDIKEILIDSEEEYRRVQEFMKLTMPRQSRSLKLYEEREPIFHKFGIETQIDRIHERRVPLPGGASLIIEQTEALVAIDVNSGRFKKEANPERSAHKVNLAAATEIARQLRLRDLGGLIILDFIDMENEDYRRDVERELWNGTKNDRARTRMLRMSRFGIIEMTRQRVRQSLKSAHYENCRTCGGTGQVKSLESLVLDSFRKIKAALKEEEVARLEVHVHSCVAQQLQNEKRREIINLEQGANVTIDILGETDYDVDGLILKASKKDGKSVKIKV